MKIANEPCFILLVIILTIILVLLVLMFPPINTSTQLKPITELFENENNIDPGSVCIFMVVTENIMDYAKHSIRINKEYCKKHGFDFKVISKNLTPDLEINFCKLQATLDLFKHYKYVVHIDADAMVVKPEYSITNIISKYPQPFIASEDCYSLDACSKPGRINSGVYIAKNTYFGRLIIQRWLNAARKGKCKKYVNKFPNCQLVFFHCVRKSWLAMFIKLVPYNLLNGKDGLFIQHYMQHNTRDRADGFINQLKKNRVDRISVF